MPFGDGLATTPATVATATAPVAAPTEPTISAASTSTPTASSGTFEMSTIIRDGIGTIFQRGMSGEFDDPALAQALAMRAGDSSPFAVAAALQMTVSQAHARMDNLARTMRAEFPLASQLPPAETGWDVESFVPRTKAEADAFAQRMVVDAVMAAGRLEVLVAERDQLHHRATTNGDAQAAREVTRLDALIATQLSYVDTLARVVDSSSNGALTDVGAVAISDARHDPAMRSLVEGVDRSLRAVASPAAPAAGIGKLASFGARAASAQVRERLVGAAVQARRIADDPARGVAEATGISRDVASFTWKHRDDLKSARARSEVKLEERRRRERADEHARAARDRTEQRRIRWQREQEYQREQRELQEHVEAERLEFRGHLLRVEQRYQQRWAEHLRALDRRHGIDTGSGRTVGEAILEVAIRSTEP